MLKQLKLNLIDFYIKMILMFQIQSNANSNLLLANNKKLIKTVIKINIIMKIK